MIKKTFTKPSRCSRQGQNYAVELPVIKKKVPKKKYPNAGGEICLKISIVIYLLFCHRLPEQPPVESMEAAMPGRHPWTCIPPS